MVVLFIIAHTICDSICDAIKDYRTYIAEHPYGDFWHVCKQIRRIALLAAGFFIHFDIRAFGYYYIIAVVVLLVPIKLFIWDALKKKEKYWYDIDRTWNIKVSFGSWVDKHLGIHN